MINTNPNIDSCTLETLSNINKIYNLVGDVLEFGTCTCQSAIQLATQFPEKTIFTIDHFQGLEKTSKPLPNTSDWREGSFALGAWNARGDVFPRTIEGAKQKLSTKPNITLVLSDIHKLTEPKDYNIGKIAICNVDVDIYEPTVSSLEFLSKCEWSEVFIRFDDWHGGESDYDQHERLAFTEWIEKYNYQYEVVHGGLYGGALIKR
jgi:hypothetical protein